MSVMNDDCIFHFFLKACLMLLNYYIFGPISKICHEILFGYLTRLSLYYNYVSVTCNTGQSCDTWTKTCIHGFSHSVANFGSFLKNISIIIRYVNIDFQFEIFFWLSVGNTAIQRCYQKLDAENVLKSKT